MRIYIQIKEILFTHKDLLLKREKIEQKLSNQDKNIELVFGYMDQLLEKKENLKPIPKINYKK